MKLGANIRPTDTAIMCNYQHQQTAVIELEVEDGVIYSIERPAHLVPRLRMTGPIPSSLYMPPGVHRDNFIF